MKNSLISIIIPVYNMEKYLAKCLDTVVNQSYTNLEILLIDDGSIDASSQICKEYLKKDNRIKYYKKKNGGLSSARNFGLDKCNGDYIGFVDSDDVIHKDMFSILYNNIKVTNSDLSICEVTRFNENPEFKVIDSYKTYSKQEVLKIILEDIKICNFAVNKLYKRDIIKDIRYPIGKVQEDVGTTYKYIMNAKKIVYTESKLYGYYSRSNSISKSINKKFVYDYFEMIEKRAIDLKEYDIDDYLDLNKVNVILGMFINLSMNKSLLIDKELKDYMTKKRRELRILHKKTRKNNTTRHNILISILLFNKEIFLLVMKLYLDLKNQKL